jgi:TPR repeat protein
MMLAPPLPANAGPFEDGVEAAERGDYTTALKYWRPLAELGHTGAQYILAVLYSTGRGVPQNDAAAVMWYRKAADQGVARAQYNLGLWYSTGRGIPQDFVSAHMWFTLAAAQGDEPAQNGRNLVTRLMTLHQIDEAQRRAREWMAKHPRGGRDL